MNKKVSVTIGLLLVAIILLTGTYAFQAFNQGAFNPAWGEELEDDQLWYEIAYGGRIHNVFEVSGDLTSPAQGHGIFNHDIFAENFGTEAIMVRVQLREFLAIDSASAIGGADITNPMTWPVYLSAPNDATERRAGTPTYAIGAAGIEWTLGQATDVTKVFMPTFNRATLPATNIDPTVPAPFNHNEAFVFTDTTGRAVDARAAGFNITSVTDVDNIYQTGTQTGVGNPTGIHGYWTAGATHNAMGIISHPATGELLTIDDRTNTAQATLSPEYGGVMTIAQWITAGRPAGNFWILDTDGWFYWHGNLPSGQATSLLLDSIELPARAEAWEYVIYVDADFFTLSEVGNLLPAPTPEMGVEIDAMNPWTYNVSWNEAGTLYVAYDALAVIPHDGVTVTRARANVTETVTTLTPVFTIAPEVMGINIDATNVTVGALVPNYTTVDMVVTITTSAGDTVIATRELTIDRVSPLYGIFTDPDTGITWYVLVPANDPRGGIGNVLLITEYVHMTNMRYHSTLGFTPFINSEARINLENWFNNPANVGGTLRGMALDYEFQDEHGVSIPRTSTAVGAGIEVNRADNTTNSAANAVPANTNVTRAHTRPILGSEGNGMAFILSTSEANEYFDNAAHRQALGAGSSVPALWWLRSPGLSTFAGGSSRHAIVVTLGGIGDGNASATTATWGLRPALWISE